MKKIGILGGTFNPIHNAHLAMAQAAYEQYGLDEVWFMPSGSPPHKKNKKIASAEHRKRMVQFAIDDVAHFRFSDFELRREGTTYTRDTLKLLCERNPKSQFYFILGGDSLRDFATWYHPEEIVRYCRILAVARNGVSFEELERACKKYSSEMGGEFLPVRMNPIVISSEDIRERIGKGMSVQGLCPEIVNRYISIHGLYGRKKLKLKKDERDTKHICACLQASLRPKRYLHTLGVSDTAANLAYCHGADGERARLAGLLHDCAKYYSDEEMIALCDRYEIALTDIERKNPALIHGKLGACLAKKRYGVKDSEIASAIRCHTTGKPDMTLLEKILYAADYIEPERHMDCAPYPLELVRKTCFQDLDRGVWMILTNTVTFLERSENETDPMTRETWEYYDQKMKKI